MSGPAFVTARALISDLRRGEARPDSELADMFDALRMIEGGDLGALSGGAAAAIRAAPCGLGAAASKQRALDAVRLWGHAAGEGWAEWARARGLGEWADGHLFAGARRVLLAAGFRTPDDLRSAGCLDMERSFGGGWLGDPALVKLWQAARPRWGADGGAHVSTLLQPDAFILARAVAGASPVFSAIGARKSALERALGLGGEALRPRQVAASLAGGGDLAVELVEATAAFNALCAFGPSLSSVASGLRRWGAFCDALGAPHFPATVEMVRAFGRWHREGDTFYVYVGHVRKGRELVGCSVARYLDSRAKSAKRGLAKQRLVFRPPKEALGGDQFLRVARLAVANSEEKLFVFTSWVFMLRAANEASLLVRAPDDSAALDPYLPRSARAAIGLRGGEVCIRLETRKNRPRGDLIRRGCACRGEARLSRHCGADLCPLCVLWRTVRRKIAVGEALFREGAAKRATVWLQGALRAAGDVRPERYTLRALRRGAAREFAEKGGSAADLREAASWSSAKVFERYLDMRKLEARAAAQASVLTDRATEGAGEA